MPEKTLLEWTITLPAEKIEGRTALCVLAGFIIFVLTAGSIFMLARFDITFSLVLFLIINLIFILIFGSCIYESLTEKYFSTKCTITNWGIHKTDLTKSESINKLNKISMKLLKPEFWLRKITPLSGITPFFSPFKSISHYKIEGDGAIRLFSKGVGAKHKIYPKNNRDKIISILNNNGIYEK